MLEKMLERLMTLEHNEYITVTQNNISFMIYVKGTFVFYGDRSYCV